MPDVPWIDLEHAKNVLTHQLIERMPETGDYATGVPGFTLYRRDTPEQPQPVVYNPVVVLVAQGEKWARLGTEEYVFGRGDCFIAGVDLPATSRMRDITPDRPFLSLCLDLNKSLIAQIASEVPPESHGDVSYRAAMVHQVDSALLDAFLRLVQLMNKPEQQKILSPLIVREIHCRLLMGPFGRPLRSICTLGSQSNQVARAITWLKDNYAEPVQVDDLARQVHMAPSTFHKHFKAMTALSPLQYQKQLRLTEAQRLMLVENLDATQAGLAVGYESQTQFNREYKRLFGAPPFRDVNRLRNESFVLPDRPAGTRRATEASALAFALPYP